MTRKQSPTIADLEAATDPVEVPGTMPPPGTKAQVKTQITYDMNVAPGEGPQARGYASELDELALEQGDDDSDDFRQPLDPVTEFCERYREYVGYNLRVVRLPDPAARRIPGQAYARPCFELEILGDTPFDPSNLPATLQMLNGNSGGVFRLLLADEYGQAIPNARLERLVISDPPGFSRNDRDPYRDRRYAASQPQQQAPPPMPQPSEAELQIQRAKDDLFQRALDRALNPPKPEPTNPLNLLSDEDRLAMMLLSKGDLLQGVVSRITSLAQAPEAIEKMTWKDKVAEAGLQLVTTNPEVIERVSGIVERIVNNLLPPRSAPAPATNPAPHPVIQRPPAQRVAPAQAEVNTGLPEVPNPNDDPDFDEDDEEYMLDEITKLLLSEKPLSLTDPVFIDLARQYPKQFNGALLALATLPEQTVLQYIVGTSEFARDMFASERTGAYLRERLAEIQTLARNAYEQQKQQTETAQATPAA